MKRIDSIDVHYSHCDIDEYAGTCKYGDDDCPVLEEKKKYIATLEKETNDLLNAGNLDLDRLDWIEIQKAVSESSWVPRYYTRNDWVNDICIFLRHGPEYFLDKKPK